MKRSFSYLGVALVLFAMLFNAAPASAATPAQANKSSSGLSITPRKNYVMEPGKKATDSLTIGNLDGKNDLIIALQVIDFSFTDETGTPKLMLAANAPQTTWSLKPFIKLPETVTIPKGSTKTIKFDISVPAGQGAGSYYSAIKYAAAGTNGGNVNLTASGVTLAFLSVPGIVNEKMTLQKLGAFQPDGTGTTGKFIFIATDKAPTEIAYSLKNEGNVAENPAGNIVVKDMFGNEVTTIKDANPRASLALIGQTRRFEACINPKDKAVDLNGQGAVQQITCNPPKLMPGRYTISLDTFYGQNGNNTHEITGKASFWYLPIWFIVTVVAGIVVIAYVIRKVYKKIQVATGKTPNPNRKAFSFKRKR